MIQPTNSVLQPSPRQGTCYGFDIHAAIPLACLRSGRGTALHVATVARLEPGPAAALIAEWREPPQTEPFARLFGEEETYWLWMNRVGWARIDPKAPRISLPTFTDPGMREEYLWTIPMSLCLLHRGDLALHAAAVEVDGQAVLVVAPSGTGKSTMAAAFAQAGHRLLSEDVTCVRMDRSPSVIPGPAMLRLRPDVLPHLTLPHSRVIRQLRSRVTFALDDAGRGGCDPVPIRAVYVIGASSNGAAGERIPPAEGIRQLWPMAFRLPVADWMARCFRHLGDLATGTPIRAFTRPARLADLPRAVENLTR